MKLKNPTPSQIKEARLALGLTQAEAAESVGAASYYTWLAWETGRRRMPAAKWELFRLKNHLS